MTSAPPFAVDLSDDETFRSGFPHEYFAWLRRQHPVFWHEPTACTPDGEGFWVVSRHADVQAVQKDALTFSSETGGGLRAKGGTGLKDESGAGTWLNQTDDPQHQRLRSVVNRGFSPRAVASLEDALRARASELLDSMDPSGCDFVHGYARELPAQVICEVLGVPEADRPELLDFLDAGIEADSPSVLSDEAMRYLGRYGRKLISAKRDRPDNAIMSTIVHTRYEGDGTQLSDDELLSFFTLLFPAGAETTRSSLAGAIQAFIDYPEEYFRLRTDPSLISTAVEEIVRWTTPSIYKRRTASRDCLLASVAISAGDKVTIWEMSANRDESVFDEPFRFDVGRTPNPHVGFGWGSHFCLGASLARLEIRVTLELLIERFGGFEAAGPSSWMPNNRLFGLKSLPVRFLS
jgi:cytochrome P450